MAEDTAPTTSAQARKRVRSEETRNDAPKSATTKNLSPKALALSSISRFSETLQHDLGTIFKQLGTEWIDIITKYRSKLDQADKMLEDDDYIPHSVPAVDFKFFVPKEMEDNAEFTIIKEETAATILEFRKTLKRQILKSMRVEIALLEQRAKKHFLHAVTTVTKATLISTRANVATIHRVVNTIMEFNHETILDETGITYDEFCAAYKLAHALNSFPLEDNPDPTSDTTPEAHHQQRVLDAFPSKTNILATLITPVTILISREKEVEVEISLKKLLTIGNLDKSCEETQTRMDLEGNVDTELLKEMINKATVDKTKTLRSELGQLKKLVKDMGSKKEGRGQPGGASKNTKKSSKKPKGKSAKGTPSSQPSPSPSANHNRRKPRGQRADAQDKDSSSNRKKNPRKKGPKKK